MSDATPRPVKALRGRVTRGVFGKGTKSERAAVFITTDEGRFVLRRKGGPAMGDDTLDTYVGKDVACDGFVLESTLLAERIAIVTGA